MSRGWEAYQYLFVAAGVSLFFPALLSFLSYLFGSRSYKMQGSQDQSIKMPHVNTRYFLAVNVAVLLISQCLVLTPIVAAIRGALVQKNEQTLGRLVFAVVVVSTFLGLGLLYSSRKGDLGWFRPSPLGDGAKGRLDE